MYMFFLVKRFLVSLPIHFGVSLREDFWGVGGEEAERIATSLHRWGTWKNDEIGDYLKGDHM